MGSTNKRSLAKVIIWEAFSFTLTALAAKLVFGTWIESIEFSGALTLVKTALLFSYERLWKKIKWGKI